MDQKTIKAPTPTWLLPITDPRRLAEEARQMRLIRELEAAAIRAGYRIRPREDAK